MTVAVVLLGCAALLLVLGLRDVRRRRRGRSGRSRRRGGRSWRTNSWGSRR
jgi:hypothetical protein